MNDGMPFLIVLVAFSIVLILAWIIDPLFIFGAVLATLLGMFVWALAGRKRKTY